MRTTLYCMCVRAGFSGKSELSPACNVRRLGMHVFCRRLCCEYLFGFSFSSPIAPHFSIDPPELV